MADPEVLDLVYQSYAPEMEWWNRIDPIHEIEWSDTVSSWWEGVNIYKGSLRIDKMGVVSPSYRAQESPIQISDKDLYNYRSITIMALLHEWGTLTTFQIATLLSMGRRATWNNLSALHSAGLIDRMSPNWWNEGEPPEDSGSGSIWKINRNSWTTEQWFDGLENLEWMLTTNGISHTESSIGVSPLAMRHNLIASEIAIRSLEVCKSVIGAWGEAHSSAHLMYEAEEFEGDQVRNNIGDATLVVKDGSIIVLEVIGSLRSESGIVEKAAAWTAICGKSELDIKVVFVDGSRSPTPHKLARLLNVGVKKEATKYVARQSVRERGQERIFMVDARDWFPTARTITTSFATLDAARVIDEQIIELAPEIEGQATLDPIVVNTAASILTPWWCI